MSLLRHGFGLAIHLGFLLSTMKRPQKTAQPPLAREYTRSADLA